MAYSWTKSGQSSEIKTAVEIAKDMIERVREANEEDEEEEKTDEG